MKKISTVKFYSLLFILLMFVSTAWLPFDFLSDLEARYVEFKTKYPYVTISVFLNQPAYSPGDTIYFSARYMHEDLKPVKGTHLIRLDIISANGITVQSIRCKTLDGKSNNQIILSKELEEGIYKLVAYSDWMKNFGADAFYQQDLKVVASNQLSLSKSPLSKDFRFYPEGGKLIAGTENNVIVIGKPDSELTIKDEQDTRVTDVKINSMGVGNFSLNPEASMKYFAYQNNTNEKWLLPTSVNDGVAIKFDETKREVLLSLSDKSNLKAGDLFALLLSEGNIIMKRQLTLEPAKPFTLSLTDHLKSSKLYQLFILNTRGVEVAQRIFTIHKDETIKVSIDVNQKYKQRDSVQWRIKVSDSDQKPVSAEVSVSAFQQDLFDNSSDMQNSLLSFFPALKQFEQINGEGLSSSINQLLVSQVWKRINWEEVYNQRAPKFSYPFQSSIKFRGKILSKADGSPVPDSMQVIGFLQKNAMGYEAFSRNGYFELPLIFDFWGEDQLFITLRNRNKCVDDLYVIQEIKDTVDLRSAWRTEKLPEADRYADYALKRNLISKSYNFYLDKKNDSDRIKSPNEILEEEFQGADHIITVSDYVVFPTMEDLLTEVVNFVQFRKRKNESSIRLFYRYEKSVYFYKEDPLYVIDGVMTTSTEDFLNLKPEDVLTIKIINNPNKLSQLGTLGQNGIIFAETKRTGLSKSLKRNVFSVTGLSEMVKPAVKDYTYSNRNKKAPDLRSALYWNPHLKSDSDNPLKGTIFLSDDIGPVKICVQGITDDGRSFYGERIITVEMNQQRE